MSRLEPVLSKIELLIKNSEQKLKKTPLVIAAITTLFWYIGLVSRYVTSQPEIALVDLGLGAIVFSTLTLLISVVKNRVPSYLLLLLTVTQALIMGMSSSLLPFGVVWALLSALLAVSLFPQWTVSLLHALQRPAADETVALQVRSSKFKTVIIVLGLISIGLFVRFYTQPGLGVNQQCYFATANQSSFHESWYDTFASVWEIKPVTHRAFVYVVYELAEKYSSFQNKEGFETAVNSIYLVWSFLVIGIGVILGRKRFMEISGIHWGYVLLLAFAFQGVLVEKAFEVEEMVFSLSVLTLGFMWSRKSPLIFLAPFLCAYITSLKILTLFVPVALILFSMTFIRFTKKEFLAFGVGTVAAIIGAAVFLYQFPPFLSEMAGARAMQQGTVFFFGGMRVATFIGTLSKTFFYNPFVLAGAVVNVLLLVGLGKEKRVKEQGAVIALWFLLGIIPLVMGKSFTYYALPFTISAFLTLLVFMKNADFITAHISKKTLLWAFLLPVVVILYKGLEVTLITSVALAVALILSRKKFFTEAWMNMFFVIFLSSLTLWCVLHTPWKSRPASPNAVNTEIVNYLDGDSGLLDEQMLYLTFGTIPYSLGIRNTNRYFYTLPMLRHAQMEKVARATKGELKYLNRFGRDMADNIAESVSFQECLAGAEAFRGKYIFHDSRGWGNFELYPQLDSLVKSDYEAVVNAGRQTLYVKKETSGM